MPNFAEQRSAYNSIHHDAIRALELRSGIIKAYLPIQNEHQLQHALKSHEHRILRDRLCDDAGTCLVADGTKLA